MSEEKIILLDGRINNLLERENEVRAEIEEINSKGLSLITKEESQRLELLEKELTKIITSKNDVIEPKRQLLSMYLEAKSLIDKLHNENINKSLRTKIINALARKLTAIKEIDANATYTSEEIEKLQTERHNPEVFNKYFNMFENRVDGSITILTNDLNYELDSLERKEKEKEEEEKEARKTGTATKIIATLTLVTVIVGVASSCNKSKKEATMIRGIENPDDSYYTTATIITSQSTPKPEPTPIVDRDTDIQDRANIVASTNFFQDAYPSDITGLLNAIQDKQMWNTENADYAQAFNTTFNRLFEKKIMGTLTYEDVMELNALKSRAKDNSDLDRFLETYTELLKALLMGQEEAHAKLAKYIEIFGTSLNGFTNEPDLLTDDETFNEHAQVNDFFDWWFAYDSIIKPTYPLLFPQRLYEVDGAVIENIMYATYNATDEGKRAYIEALGLQDYENLIFNQIKLYELQYLMESALVNHPQFCEIKNVNELTLGGN